MMRECRAIVTQPCALEISNRPSASVRFQSPSAAPSTSLRTHCSSRYFGNGASSPSSVAAGSSCNSDVYMDVIRAAGSRLATGDAAEVRRGDRSGEEFASASSSSAAGAWRRGGERRGGGLAAAAAGTRRGVAKGRPDARSPRYTLTGAVIAAEAWLVAGGGATADGAHATATARGELAGPHAQRWRSARLAASDEM